MAATMKIDTSFLPTFDTKADERLYLKQRLAAAYRLFGKFGFDEGVAGHITVRDPEFPDTFWVNPWGVNFKQINVSSLIRVDEDANILDGEGALLNGAAFAIHSQLHAARPDVVAAAHSHSLYGKAFSSLGKPLRMITQDACVFHDDHAVFNDYTGVVVDPEEGKRLAAALGDKKALILQNHGLLTVGQTVDAAIFAFITLERSCQAQLLAEAAGDPIDIPDDVAAATYATVGTPLACWFSFLPLYDNIVLEQPDLLD